MPIVKLILASLAIAAGVLATLMFVVLMFASMPNSKPDDLRTITRWMILAGVGGLLCLGGGVWLLLAGQVGWSAAVGAAPLIVFVIVMIAVSIR